MHETRFEFQQPGYADRMAALFAANAAEKLADYLLSERLGRELAEELGLDLNELSEAA